MKKILLSTLLVLAFAATSYATPLRTAEFGTVPKAELSEARQGTWLYYVNFCAGWVWYWSGYCFFEWTDDVVPVQFGTCFDLADAPPDCRHLYNIVWGAKRFTPYGYCNVEVFCADEYCCPVGAPLCGVYNYNILTASAWQRFYFEPYVPVCPCEDPPLPGKFIVMITMTTSNSHATCYSDINAVNIQVGCETDWRCTGHSYCYKSGVSYCDVYGVPGGWWVSGDPSYGCTNPPAVPPGCHGSPGYFSELLMYVYMMCEGPTATQSNSWSEIKALYK